LQKYKKVEIVLLSFAQTFDCFWRWFQGFTLSLPYESENFAESYFQFYFILWFLVILHAVRAFRLGSRLGSLFAFYFLFWNLIFVPLCIYLLGCDPVSG
jgi:hypothetical protein